MNEECPAMSPTGAFHRWGYNPFLNAHFCQDCGACSCPEHNMLTLHTGQPTLAGVEDYIPPRYRFIRNPLGCGNADRVLEYLDALSRGEKDNTIPNSE